MSCTRTGSEWLIFSLSLRLRMVIVLGEALSILGVGANGASIKTQRLAGSRDELSEGFDGVRDCPWSY